MLKTTHVIFAVLKNYIFSSKQQQQQIRSMFTNFVISILARALVLSCGFSVSHESIAVFNIFLLSTTETISNISLTFRQLQNVDLRVSEIRV